MTDLQYKARLLELKTEVVLNGVEYGNGMIAFLMIIAQWLSAYPALLICTIRKRWIFTTAYR